VKKIASFSQVLKKMRTKANCFFFFLAVYILSWAVSCVFCSFDLYISLHTHTHTRTHARTHARTHTHTHTHTPALFSGSTRVSRYQKGKTFWILLKQETVSGSGISWAICKSALRSRQITMPAPHHSVFLQAGFPSCRPTNSVKALKAVIHGDS